MLAVIVSATFLSRRDALSPLLGRPSSDRIRLADASPELPADVVHTCILQWGIGSFLNVRQFAKALKRVRRWYQRQRKHYRKRRGILRDRQALRVRAVRKAMTKKLRSHFKRTLAPSKLESMWAWAEVARALHKAKVPVLSGTNPVEQFWSFLQGMLPSQARKLSLRWFRVLAQIAYLRHNFCLFSKGSTPRWADGDSILGQRLENLATLCEVLREDTELNHFQDLRGQFES